MSVIEGVLLEELERLENNIVYYKQQLSSLPRGSIVIRKVGNSSFAYRNKKVNGKVICEYLGNINNEDVQKQIELSDEYKRMSENLRIVNSELKKLKKACKAFQRK